MSNGVGNCACLTFVLSFLLAKLYSWKVNKVSINRCISINQPQNWIFLKNLWKSTNELYVLTGKQKYELLLVSLRFVGI